MRKAGFDVKVRMARLREAKAACTELILEVNELKLEFVTRRLDNSLAYGEILDENNFYLHEMVADWEAIGWRLRNEGMMDVGP